MAAWSTPRFSRAWKKKVITETLRRLISAKDTEKTTVWPHLNNIEECTLCHGLIAATSSYQNAYTFG
jgi:hypothetical protein